MRRVSNEIAKAMHERLAGRGRARTRCAAPDKRGDRRSCDVTAIQQGAEGIAKDRALDAGEEQPHVFVRDDERARGAKREVECLVRKARHLGLVGDFKPRLDVRLEREFAQETETERVDRRDLNISDAIAEQRPAIGRDLAAIGARHQLGHDAAAHFRRRLPRKRDGEHVSRIDALLYQPDVSLDEHARLPRARRRLENDVIGGIDGERARRVIRRQRVRRRLIIEQAGLVGHSSTSAASASARNSLRQTPAYRQV